MKEEQDDIKNLKAEWSRKFGPTILNDPADQLPPLSKERLSQLKSISSLPTSSLGQSMAEESTSTFKHWWIPFMAAASIAALVWLGLSRAPVDSNAIDWAVLDDIATERLQLELDPTTIDKYAEDYSDELDGMLAFDVDEESLENWLNNDKDLWLWLE